MKRLMGQSRGDTIVEVMIAMAVATTILGSAYTITNRSLGNTRLAQEHTEALKIAQSQAERIRALAPQYSSGSQLFDPYHAYCVTSTGTLQQFLLVNTLPSEEANYPSQCKDLGSVNYRTGFTFDNSAGVSDFTVYVEWPGLSGTDNRVSLVYKVYPGE